MRIKEHVHLKDLDHNTFQNGGCLNFSPWAVFEKSIILSYDMILSIIYATAPTLDDTNAA